jgi:type VI protein secretion system component Hcp
VERSGEPVSGSSRQRGAATVDHLVLAFDYERAAPKLLEKCPTGTVLPMLEVELARSIGEQGRSTYLKYPSPTSW